MTKKQVLDDPNAVFDLAEGIATGVSALELAANIGVDRSTLRGWMNNPKFLEAVAAKLEGPDDLGDDALDTLFDEDRLDGERKDQMEVRALFSQIVFRRFSDYFAKRAERIAQEAEEERRRKAEADRIAEERWKVEQAKAEKNRKAVVACLEADFFNLSTLVEVHRANWKLGTEDERRQGLDTPEKRRAHRIAHGIVWDCAGHGPYYSPRWSAIRCEMKYCEDDHGGGVNGFDVVHSDPHFKQAWREINEEAERNPGDAYYRNPLAARRDANLPTTPAEAEAVLRAIKNGAKFSDAIARVRRGNENAKKE